MPFAMMRNLLWQQRKKSCTQSFNWTMVVDMFRGFNFKYGNMSTNPELPYNSKNRSVFFEQPYWKDNLVRHNLDVMQHIEKNVCESVILFHIKLSQALVNSMVIRVCLVTKSIFSTPRIA